MTKKNNFKKKHWIGTANKVYNRVGKPKHGTLITVKTSVKSIKA